MEMKSEGKNEFLGNWNRINFPPLLDDRKLHVWLDILPFLEILSKVYETLSMCTTLYLYGLF